jgi:hypothetical protein
VFVAQEPRQKCTQGEQTNMQKWQTLKCCILQQQKCQGTTTIISSQQTLAVAIRERKVG